MRIDYTFQNEALLTEALTHTSYANERALSYSYERLEFLGDAVFELLVSELLYNLYPDMTEGDLTKKRANMVCEASLSQIARSLELGRSLLLGHGEDMTGGRERDSILADVLEAVIGAVFLDGGLGAARKLVAQWMEPQVSGKNKDVVSTDHKSQLQEVIQRSSMEPLVYAITGETGPDHDKQFEVSVSHSGKVLGKGVGRSKKEAEQKAALKALGQL